MRLRGGRGDVWACWGDIFDVRHLLQHSALDDVVLAHALSCGRTKKVALEQRGMGGDLAGNASRPI